MVPKIIHQIVGKQPSELVARCVKSWTSLKDAGFEFMRWDDPSLEKFLKHFYPEFLAPFLNARNHGEASDIARYLLVHHYGGHYIDWDIELLSIQKFVELNEQYPFGYVVQDPVNQSLASEAFSAIPGEKFLYNVVDNIAYIFENGFRDSLGTPDYSGPYRMRDVYYFTKKDTKQKPVKIKDIFLYDYWEIRQMPPRNKEVAMIHYWENSWKEDFDSTNSEVFTKIYLSNSWGGTAGQLYSGTGSHNDHILGYSEAVSDFIVRNGISSIVEIGCGDFFVTNNILQQLDSKEYNYTYMGYDVVEKLIEQNIEKFEKPNINFINQDCCIAAPNQGELLIIRQVLQHLNNHSVKQIVKHFKQYKYILVTEHQFDSEEGIIRNKDKKTGAETRLANKSGLYLESEPFNCSVNSLLYSIPERQFDSDASINTYLITNVQLLSNNEVNE